MNTTTKSESLVLASAQPGNIEVVHRDAMPVVTNSQSLVLDPEHMKSMVAVAEIMASARATVPRHLAGNRGDCLAVVMQSTLWRMNPFAVAQKTHLVNGTLGYEAQLVNAVVQTMAPCKDRFNYEWFGEWERVMGKFEERTSTKKKDEDTGQPLKYRVPAWNIADEAGLGIRVWATMKGEAEPRVLELLLVQCRVRNSPLWADDPRQQIAYLAVKRWVRLHCPDVLLGVYTPDELAEAPRNMGDADVVIPEKLLERAEEAAGKGISAYRDLWEQGLTPQERDQLQPEHKRLKDLAVETDRKRTVESGAGTKAATSAPAPAPAPAPRAAPPKQGQPVTADQVADMLNKAADRDALDIAADWIRDLPAEQQPAANALYEKRASEL